MNRKITEKCLLLGSLATLHLVACSSGQEFHGVQGKPTPVKTDDAAPERIFIEKSFELGAVYDEKFSAKPSKHIVGHNFLLHKEPATTVSFEQADRPISVETKIQGSPGEALTQKFASLEAGQLDILIVMDNSGTMKTYQDQLASKLEPLLLNITNTNWQIGVVTTDNPCLRDVITKQMYEQDPVAARVRFGAAVSPGTKGSTVERGIEMAIKGLSGACTRGSSPWLRPEAVTAVVMVSDEENCGSGSDNCASRVPEMHRYTPQEFVDAAPAGTRVYGLLQSNDVCGYDGYEVVPQNYYDLIAQTSGTWSPICSSDYESILKGISLNIGSVTKSKYLLDHAPQAGSVVVTAGANVYSSGFTVEGSKVTVPRSLIGDETSISIGYYFAAAELWTSLALSKMADPNTVMVEVDGKAAAADSFTLQPDQVTILFAQAPVNMAKVVVRFRGNDVLPNVFAIETKNPVYDLQIIVDGVATTLAVLDPADNTVRFSQPPADGSKINIKYRLEKDIQTSYDTPHVNGHSVHFVSLVDDQTGETIACEYEDGKIKLLRDQIVDLKSVRANFNTSAMDTFFPHSPNKGTLEITHPKDLDECLKNAVLTQAGTMLQLDCPGVLPEEIGFSYQYTEEIQAPVDMGRLIDLQAPVQMWVNEQEISDFTVEGGIVMIPEKHLIKGNKIRVKALVLNRGKIEKPESEIGPMPR